MAGFTPISVRILLCRSAYTHTIRAQHQLSEFILGISFLEIFYTVGILSKNFYDAGRWKCLIAIDCVLNLELDFFEVFLIDCTFILHAHYLKKKIKQQNH